MKHEFFIWEKCVGKIMMYLCLVVVAFMIRSVIFKMRAVLLLSV
jgi:hypothetical protein